MPEQPPRTAPYVFLSYASADRARAFPIAERLEAAGVPVWLDRHSIGGGTRWSAAIAQGIRGCAALVLLASPAALRSRNVHQEIQLAWEHDKPLVPLLLEAAPLPIEVEYVLAGRQWVEVLDQPEEVWLPRALEALRGLGLAGRPPATDQGSPLTDQGPLALGHGLPAEDVGPAAVVARPAEAAERSPLSRLLARAPLVGRVAELRYLREQYEAAAGGQGGRLVFISGEPGAGKTRLALEVGRYAQERGGLFLEGHYLRAGTAAFGPWIEALRMGLRTASPTELAHWVGASGPDLAQTTPELITPLGPLPAPPAVPPDEQRRRVFDGLSGLLIGLSQKTPLVLLLDDLQWTSDLDLLQHVARRLGEARALVIGTYRQAEFKEQPALMREWAELNRARLATEINLHLLSEPETAELIAHYFGRAVSARLRGPVYRQTRGNAFFTEEVLRSLTECGAVRAGPTGWEVTDSAQVTIPESMKLAVEERVARLGPAVQEVLVQAAVLGQEFSLPVLKELSGRSEGELIDALDRALAAQVLVDRSTEGEERLAFLDDQIQEVLYAALPPLRRRGLHRRAGQALEQLYQDRPDRIDAHLEDLARHFGEAHDLPKAADYAYRCGEKCERLFLWRRAVPLYAQAADALAHLDDSEQNRRRRIDALVKQVGVSWAADDPERVRDLLTTARSLLDPLLEATAPSANDGSGDQVRLARILYWMGRTYGNQGDIRQAIAHYQKVLELARQSGDAQLLALPSGLIGRTLVIQGRYRQGEVLLSQALMALEQTGDAPEWLLAVAYRGLALAGQGRYADGWAEGERALARARQLHDETGTALTHVLRAAMSFHGRDFPRMLEESQLVWEAATTSGDRLLAHLSLGFRGVAESWLDQHEAAQQSLAESRAIGQSIGGRLINADTFAAMDAELALAAGRLEEACALAEQAVASARGADSLLAQGIAQRVLGQVRARLNPANPFEADEHFGASLRCFEEGEARLEAARTHVVWGQLLRDRGDLAAAREHLAKAAAQFEASRLTEELEQTRRLLEELT